MGSNPILDICNQNFIIVLRNYFFNRPISPHLSIYLPQISSIFSIWHRISGILLTIVLIIFLLVPKLLIQSNFINFFFYISLPIWFWKFFYLAYTFIFMYHALNGIRHINWDLILLLEVKMLNRSAIVLVIFLFFILIKVILTY